MQAGLMHPWPQCSKCGSLDNRHHRDRSRKCGYGAWCVECNRESGKNRYRVESLESTYRRIAEKAIKAR